MHEWYSKSKKPVYGLPDVNDFRCKKIDPVLPKCRENLFSVNHSLTDLSSLLNLSPISAVKHLFLKQIKQSHQHIVIIYNLQQPLNHPLISKTEIEPCETPHGMLPTSDNLWSTSTT